MGKYVENEKTTHLRRFYQKPGEWSRFKWG